MKHKSYMTISEFAHITGIKRANLIFYDKIGLLTPEFREANNYRCYSRQQLNSAYLISALRELGLSLDEIRLYAKSRTPERLIALLSDQKQRIQNELLRLHGIKDMMALYTSMAEEGLECDTEQVILHTREREPIYLGDSTEEYCSDEASNIAFFQAAADRGIAQGYPMGCVIRKDLLNRVSTQTQQTLEDSKFVDRYYFKVKRGQNAFKPQGLYAVSFGRCSYGKSWFLYKRILDFIASNNLQIMGDAYEEYPLNEMAIQDESHYLTKVEIMVTPS